MSVPLPRCPPAPPCKGTADLLTPLPVRHHPIGQLEKVLSPLSPTPCSWFGASPGGQEASQPPETGPWAMPMPNPGQVTSRRQRVPGVPGVCVPGAWLTPWSHVTVRSLRGGVHPTPGCGTCSPCHSWLGPMAPRSPWAPKARCLPLGTVR